MTGTDPAISFGEWVKRRRRALDLTQAELALNASCSVFAVRKIESGERRPSQQLAALLAASLEIPPAEQHTFVQAARGLRSASQLGASSLAAEPGHPPPARHPLPSPNLPVSPTPLIGREPELGELTRILGDPTCRLLTIVGLPGIGKTRLAGEIALHQTGQYTDGVFFVSLASLTSAEFIVAAIADAVGFSISGPEDAATQLFSYLHPCHTLLVLDNMEHLLDGTAVLADLLGHAPDVKLLVTSRERLNLRDEWVFVLHGLPVPAADEEMRLDDYSSVALFLARARQAKTEFSPDQQEEQTIAHICRMVEGMPLAIELAAAWAPVLSCAEIAREIESNLEALTTTLRDVPARHRSLAAAFDHSWALLSDDEQAAFRKLSIFAGGFEREAAEHLADASLRTLSALIDKSLVRRNGAGRYAIHTLLRHYGQDRLAATGEEEHVRAQHRDWFLSLAEQAVPVVFGSGEPAWLERLWLERDNFRRALQWSLDRGEAEEALRLVSALSWFWYVRADFSEARRWFEQTLAVAGGVPLSYRAIIQARAGNFAIKQRDYQRGVALAEESLQYLYETGNLWEAGWTLQHLGLAAMRQGEFERAGRLYAESADLFKQGGHHAAAVNLLMYQGLAACYQREYERSKALLEESLIGLRELRDGVGIAKALQALGLIALQERDTERAKALLKEGVSAATGLGARLELVQLLEGLAAAACEDSQFERSCALFGYSDRLRATLSTPLSSAEQAAYADCHCTVRAQLREDVFTEAWAWGQTMTTEQVVAYALSEDAG